VVFLDHVPDQDLALFYNVADVTVMPSLYEGFGLPALESMACGTPVVAANAASLPEVVGDAGLLVDPHDVEGFAQNLHRVLSDSDLRDHLGQRSIERARRFSIAEQANRTLSVYATLGARQ
jgi:glycosyltransferase involved in cell wall biosynthesis